MDNKIEQEAYQSIVQEMRQALYDWMIENNDNLIFEYQALRMRGVRP
jgi:hypothetical protein